MAQILENRAFNGDNIGTCQKSKGRQFHIAIVKEEEGGYSVAALNLPGVGSCGDTPEEALENFQEAARGAVESYEEAGEEIPWKETTAKDIPSGADHKWIIVYV